jgi:hypothetical protein
MEPFEDILPAEQEAQAAQLIALLRQAYRQEPALSKNDQQNTINRVEERLSRVSENIPLLAEQAQKKAATGGAFLPESQNKLIHQRPLMRVMSTIAAVLVVGVLIGSTVLLLTQYTHLPKGQTTTPGLATPTSTPNSADIKWDGLEMSMKITPGPYFLGELLAVDLSLTNHTHSSLILSGKNDGSEAHPCSSYSLRPKLTGGTSPHYSLYTKPVPFVYACGLVGDGPALVPGRTIVDHFYVLLTSSGEVTLAGVAFFDTLSPLTGHLPTLHIQVAPQVPADRIISLQRQGSEVMAHAPASIHLIGQTYILCQVSSTDRGTPGGYDYWQTLSTHTLQRPACPDMNGWANGQQVTTHWTIILWKYAIGAIGYEVAQGQFTDTITSHT